MIYCLSCKKPQRERGDWTLLDSTAQVGLCTTCWEEIRRLRQLVAGLVDDCACMTCLETAGGELQSEPATGEEEKDDGE